MKKLLTILMLFSIIFIGCKKQKDECFTVTSDFLQGNWSDYETSTYDIAGKLYSINLKEDSFYFNLHEYTDLVLVPCNYINSWTKYSKGSWTYSNDLLILNGYYCDENYNKLTVSPCQQVIDTGKFYMEFNNVYYCNDTLVLQNTSLNDWQGLIKLKRE